LLINNGRVPKIYNGTYKTYRLQVYSCSPVCFQEPISKHMCYVNHIRKKEIIAEGKGILLREIRKKKL
jgi:hypothetical protein